MENTFSQQLIETLSNVYAGEQVEQLVNDIDKEIKEFKKSLSPERREHLQRPFDLKAKDMALITYANTIEDKSGKRKPLEALTSFYKNRDLKDVLPIVHILPFYPWDTDRGFSVKDYRQVHPDYGNWNDVAALDKHASLMFDFVANHASVENPLIQSALINRHLPEEDSRHNQFEQYKDFVIAYDKQSPPSQEDIEKLSRPRPNPVLSPYVVEDNNGKLKAFLGQPGEATGEVVGEGLVWTTFSRAKKDDGTEDTRQVDLNFANPNVFLEVVRILFFYLQQGADLIRLDAIAYIWKNLGSVSVHEPQAHALLRAMDIVLTSAAPGSVTIAEVNEPEDSYFTYLGEGNTKESDMVYQFAHFPLAIHALITESGEYYTKWLGQTGRFKGRQFTTVLGSHDGLGIKPVREILPEEELERLTNTLATENGGLANHGKLPGGKEIIYEVASTPWNLLNKPDSGETFETQLSRYLTVLALGLLPRGIPAIYFNGLIGALNYQPPGGLDENRTINREIFDATALKEKLDDIDSQERKVLDAISDLLKKRASQSAFNPNAPDLEIITTDKKEIIAVKIPDRDSSKSLLAVHNISKTQQTIEVPTTTRQLHDVISNQVFTGDGTKVKLSLPSYQFYWLAS